MDELEGHRVTKEVIRKKRKRRAFFFTFKVMFKTLTLIIGFSILGSTVSAYGIYKSVKDEFKDVNPKNNVTQTTFFDKNGDIIYESYGAREPKNIKLEEMPQHLIEATLAAEDLDFYNHEAYDLKSILRAVYKNYMNSSGYGLEKLKVLFDESSYSEGGSTITQQLVKNIYLTNERSFERKLKEVIYAVELEKRYTKDEILEMYLSNIYYGEQALGIVNAAEVYFDKEVKDLTPAQATMLTGLPAAPTRYSPISGDFKEAKMRQEYVLQRMYFANFITLKEAKTVVNEELFFAGRKELVLKYPYFVDWVKKGLYEEYGEKGVESGGMKVYTTLDPDIQNRALEIAKEKVSKLSRKDVENASVVVIDPNTNEVLAMVGGLDYKKSKVNVATSHRQPGSSFKPVVYFSGLEAGYTASSKLLDRSVNFGGNPPYRPKNYDGGYRGYVTIRDALAGSLNVPAVEMLSLVGLDGVIDNANKLGIRIGEDAKKCGLALALGCKEVRLLDMTNAYAVFASNGKSSLSTGVKSILSSSDKDIYEKDERKQVVSAENSYIITHILSDEKARRKIFGYGNKLEIGRPAAAKTGTTDNYTDSWTIGYTPDFVVGVWVGNNDRKPMKRVGGISGAALIWNDLMKNLHEGREVKEFTPPAGIVEAKINPRDGKAVANNRWGILEVFKDGTIPINKPDLSYLNPFR